MRRARMSGSPGDRMKRALQRDPFVDQRAGVGAGDAGFRGAQMAQPAEAEHRGRPFLRRRRDLERRAAVADHHLAGEREAAGVDLAGAGAVGGAQILRRDHQAVGLARNDVPADQRMAAQPAGQVAHAAAPQQHGQLDAFRHRKPGHGRVRLFLCSAVAETPPPSPVATYSEGWNSGQLPANASRFWRFGPRRSRPARPCAAPDRAGGRAASAGRRPASGARRARRFPPPQSAGAAARDCAPAARRSACSPSSGSSEQVQ